MPSAAEMYRRLQSVSKITTLREMVYVHIKANEDILRDLKEEEYEHGNIRNDKTVSGYKNVDYAEIKHEQNPLAGFGVVDLIRTGNFINSFRLNKPKQNKYIWGATDSKRNKLVGKYGNIMGLEQQTFEDFQYVIIKPLFINDLKKIINKK